MDTTQVDSASNVYFLQESVDGKFEIYFGDGIVGKALSDGNVVRLRYVVTNKSAANGASGFNTTASFSGITSITVETVSVASGGAEKESISSIKYNAPLDYAAQGRAVTINDYKAIVPKVYPNAKSVQVYGGEDAENPVYGRVYISIVPTESSISASAKAQIVTDLKNSYSIASIIPEVIDPEYTKLELTTTFNYNSKNTVKSSETLISNVISTIRKYNTENLTAFNNPFRHSALTTLIDDTDNSITSNITTIKLTQAFTPTLNFATKYTIKFNNALYNPHSGHNAASGGILSSSGFKISGNTNEIFLDDDGNGNVRSYYNTASATKSYVDETAGTINYTTGEIILTSFNITSVSDVDGATATTIKVKVVPDSNDVIAVRNQVLEIDLDNSKISAQTDKVASGSASSGVGVTSPTSYSSSSY